jgi:hypothetical protein
MAGIWRSRADAQLGGNGPWHRQARSAAREIYEYIEFSAMKLVIDAGSRQWEITDWTDTD